MDDSWTSLIGTSIAHFANDGGLYVFVTLLPVLPIPGSFLIGSLGAFQNLFSVVASPFIGRKADSAKSHGALLSLGLVIIGIGITGYALSVVFTTGFALFLFLVPFAIIGGIGSSFYHPLAASILYDKWKGSGLGRAMGINGAIGSVGRAIYPLFVGALVVYFTVPSVAVLALVSFLIAALVAYSFRNMGKMGKEGSLAKKEENSSTVAKGTQQNQQEPQIRQQTPLGLLLPKILALTLVAFTRGLFAIGLVYWLTIYLKDVRQYAYGLDVAIFSFVLAMAILGQPVFGTIADRMGKRLALAISVVCSSLAMLAFLLLSSSNTILAVIFLGIFGFSGLTGFPLLLPLATSIAPEGSETIASSIVWGIGNVGGGVAGPFLIGLLAEPAFLGSLTGGFYVVIGIGLLALIFLPFVPKARQITRSDGHT